MKHILLFPLTVILLCACNREVENLSENPKLKEAYVIHQQSVELYKEVKGTKDSLSVWLKNFSAVALGVLSEAEEEASIATYLKAVDKEFMSKENVMIMQDQMEHYDSTLQAWHESLTEVPGFQDHETHHPDHNHGESLIKDIPPKKILKMQKKHLEDLMNIQKELDRTAQSRIDHILGKEKGRSSKVSEQRLAAYKSLYINLD
ncbi:MAG: hypothetical protein AAFY71_11000 [Bacteroidota bacterium]